MCDKEKVVTENRIQRENHNVVTRSKKRIWIYLMIKDFIRPNCRTFLILKFIFCWENT